MDIYPLTVHTSPTPAELGKLAGQRAAELLGAALAENGRARVMLAAAPSQQPTLQFLAAQDLDFANVEFFHMDDYLALPTDSPVGFGNWLHNNFLSLLRAEPVFHRIDISADPDASAAAYSAEMGDDPFDLTLCGLGVNAHLAFNDPPADFNDPRSAKVVELDQTSRQQQVGEGHFPTLDDVPKLAITVTIPRLLNARHVICSVPGAEKRDAVARTIAGDPDPMIPGTALKLHPDAHLYVDEESNPNG